MPELDELKPAPFAQSLSAVAIVLALAAAVCVAGPGGLGAGALMAKFGMLAQVTLLVLGIIAGMVSRRITVRPVVWIGLLQAAAVVAAWYLATCYWLRYAEFVGGQGANTWGEALPMFFQLHRLAPSFFFAGLVCTALGAVSAYMRAGSMQRMI